MNIKKVETEKPLTEELKRIIDAKVLFSRMRANSAMGWDSCRQISRRKRRLQNRLPFPSSFLPGSL
jgi:hypothetical protein